MISTTDLDDKIRDLLVQLDQVTPPPPPFDELGRHPHTDRPRVAAMAAAAAIVVLGVGGIVAVSGRDQGPATQQASSSAPETATAPTTTPAQTTTTVPGDTTPSCAIAGAQAVVPNVAGMPWGDAAAVLTTAGLQSNPIPELPSPFETPDTDYVIIRQATAPGTITPCGTTIDILVAYRPGILYIVQEDDTYESIAASQGVTLEELLGFNDLSIAQLEAAGRSPASPLALGQALRLGACPTPEGCSGPSNDLAPLNTVPDPAILETTTTA